MHNIESMTIADVYKMKHDILGLKIDFVNYSKITVYESLQILHIGAGKLLTLCTSMAKYTILCMLKHGKYS